MLAVGYKVAAQEYVLTKRVGLVNRSYRHGYMGQPF
jgi:hypothetical protein